MSYPNSVMRILRKRQGLKPNDKSMDDQLNQLTPMEALEEIAAWELGYDGWAETFVCWAESVGLEVKEIN